MILECHTIMPRRRPPAFRPAARLLLALLLVTGAVSSAAADDLAIKVLSNRANLISGGDALVEIVIPSGVPTSAVHVIVNDVEVTTSFGLTPTGRFVGLVDTLVLGDNDVEAAIDPPTPHQSAHITIVDHSIGGPVFAGAQLQPWVCAHTVATSVSVTVPGTGTASVNSRVSGLADEPVDAQCNTPPTLAYFYQPKALEGSGCTFTNTGGGACFTGTYNPASPPADADIADFTNDHGDTVKSIIVLEKGTINRTVYQLVTFYNPNQPNPPQNPQHGWNHKLLWNFGASSGTSRFESPPGTSVFNTTALSRGYMIASASLTDHGTNANDQLGAETVAMLKEQITETYGEIRYTMGAGCSGGSIMQYNIAAAYPGLLNGIQPNCTFPDTLTTSIEVAECGMLQNNYYTTAPGNTLSTAQRGAINGHNTTNYCLAWILGFLPTGNPATAANCGSGWPAALTYNAVTRPQGVRCEVFDHDVAMLGTFVDTDGNTKANIPFDNVGVQYGLKPLQAGTINAEQFVQLQEGVGSYTADQIFVKPKRAVALASTLDTVYTGSLVSDGRQLAKTAIIDLRGNNTALDIHLNWRSWQVRDRLDRANGNHNNQVIWATGAAQNTPGAAMLLRSFNTMDTWLANIEADLSPTPLEQKIVSNKPPLAVDLCTTGNGGTEASIVDVGLGTPACPVQFTLSPRQAAGGPQAEDIFKCQLKPLDFASPDYNGVVFSAVQQGRLTTIFPDGVCDWTLPGVGQVPADGWTTFENGPGGEPLGDPPVSDLIPPVCGDGVVTAEDCDDGNTVAGDGCSATCTIEAGYDCTGSPSICTEICGDGLVVGAEGCDDGGTSGGDGCTSGCLIESGFSCVGAPSVCSPICGDGLIHGGETCDDNNTTAGDGCSATCSTETGFDCTGSPSTCTAICGDGLVLGTETCDDGNLTAADGCSASCSTETGYNCAGSPSTCTAICGDGLVLGAETCDDHNTTAGDGCSATCSTETGFGCTGSPSTCTAICGDGLVRGTETCDDGNLTAADGCSASCSTETGYNCAGSPSTCTAICGDGLVLGTETCDDGNLTAADGCSASCSTETGYNCAGSPSTCTAICGDGLVLGTETCDDGNLTAADGCSASCSTETGYNCAGSPSTCTAICGDGLVLGTETCDDGNLTAADGCSASCSTETGYNCAGSPSTCTAICGDGLVLGTEICDDGNLGAGDGCSTGCTVETGWNCAGAPSSCTPICGDSLVLGSEGCDEGVDNGSAAGCCAATCQPKASGASCDDGNACTTADTCDGANSCVGGVPPNCDDGIFCNVDSCVPATGCAHDTAPRDGFACNDDNVCSSGDVCSGGVCSGVMGADSDGDGYCDDSENARGCNPNDAAEIPPQSPTFGGSPVNGAGNILVTFLVPTNRNVAKGTDPSCATAGVCGGNGFCTEGKVADHCTANADCNQPAGTCRIVANYADVPALMLRKPVKLNKTVLTSFEPLTRGCSRKIDITLDPAKRSNVLKINVSGSVSGTTRRDTDNFRYR